MVKLCYIEKDSAIFLSNAPTTLANMSTGDQALHQRLLVVVMHHDATIQKTHLKGDIILQLDLK